MRYICPLLTVKNIRRSKKFYEKILGQKVKHDFSENITFKGDFAIHSRAHFQGLIGDRPVRAGGNNFELYFEHDDIDGLAGKLERKGVKFLHKVREQPWMQKVIRLYDPDRNIVEIGESMEYLSYRLSRQGKTVKEISGMISMPEQFVTGSIRKFRRAFRASA